MRTTTIAVATLALSLGTGAALAKDKPKETVRFAPSWEEAVEEAKLLNVPIVVHNHGFN